MRKIIVRHEHVDFKNAKITGIEAGVLYRDGGFWVFEYNEDYFNRKGSMPIINLRMSNESRMTKSKTLFPFFSDRLPDKDSETYAFYAKRWKVDVNSTDEMEILTTIGHRGASSFAFYPDGFKPGLWAEVDGDLIKWNDSLFKERYGD